MAVSRVAVGAGLQLCMSLYPGSSCLIYLLQWLALGVSLVSVRMIASGLSLVSSWPSAGKEVEIPRRPLTFQVMSRKGVAGVMCVCGGGSGTLVGVSTGVVGALVSLLSVWTWHSGSVGFVGR